MDIEHFKKMQEIYNAKKVEKKVSDAKLCRIEDGADCEACQ